MHTHNLGWTAHIVCGGTSFIASEECDNQAVLLTRRFAYCHALHGGPRPIIHIDRRALNNH